MVALRLLDGVGLVVALEHSAGILPCNCMPISVLKFGPV